MWFCFQTSRRKSHNERFKNLLGSCSSSLLLLGDCHQKQSGLKRHQAMMKVRSATSPSPSDELCQFYSDLKDAIGNLWDLPLASSLLVSFTRRLRNCNRKDPNTVTLPKAALFLKAAANPCSFLQALPSRACCAGCTYKVNAGMADSLLASITALIAGHTA